MSVEQTFGRTAAGSAGTGIPADAAGVPTGTSQSQPIRALSTTEPVAPHARDSGPVMERASS
ncbi:hypothetical protein MU0083_001465 [[Mycobacterium] kokjensenii]|uniref:Uncharacterized protein n=1 Tax=[Mycobacterium] kokjensenii TaxID=3064287 RepID=A0ABM9LCB6_9MYCO|nr:hypothetical protein [Mycolicibacter sp. MU0083]CAJ1496621.1 hypothetical protein MU0083_001465 [Mycolicibacter sp. MU0083]